MFLTRPTDSGRRLDESGVLLSVDEGESRTGVEQKVRRIGLPNQTTVSIQLWQENGGSA